MVKKQSGQKSSHEKKTAKFKAITQKLPNLAIPPYQGYPTGKESKNMG